MATLNWLPVEALLISFESAHGDAELASVLTDLGTPPTLPLYRQVGCCWTGTSQVQVQECSQGVALEGNEGYTQGRG